MRAVNLLPEDQRPGSRWKTVGRGASARRVLGGAGVAAGVLALAFAALTLQQRNVVDERRTELKDVESRLVAAQAQAVAVQQAQAASEARFSALQTLVAQRVVWEDVLRDLAKVLPSGVFLQGLQSSSPTLIATAVPGATPSAAATPGAFPTGFTVTGSADSQVRVAQVLDRLALLPWLTDVTLQSSVRTGGASGIPVQFVIGATLGSTGDQP
jgi:Tfp pilus assembly protein PilN